MVVLSLTPSLLPRPELLQGVISGVSFGLGYLVGQTVAASVRPWTRRLRVRPVIVWSIVGAAVAVGAILFVPVALGWQNGVRAAVEMPPLDARDPVAFLIGFVATSVLLLAAGRGCRRLYLLFRAKVGSAVAVIGAVTVSAAVLIGIGGIGMAVLDGVYAERNGAPPADAVEPASTYRSAGDGSAIRWADLGRHGAAFVGGGPTKTEIEDATHRPALDPIRVYAGVASASDTVARARLVVDELVRTGAFDRTWLVVATSTGSGWLEPQTVDAFEYLHGGDTAIASMQYSYLPSWVSFVFDPDAPVAASRALFDAVYAHWSALPADHRPKLVAYGLSLGAHGTQAVFTDLQDLRSRTDAAMLVGSPNGSAMWRTLQAARDAGSPAWRPVLDAGRDVRWMSKPGDEKLLPGVWEQPRVVYLQHATDPVTWLGTDLIWSQPDWLRDGQRGPDISPAMRWIPVVTAAQVTVDMLMGESVPARHGHNYGDVVLAGWRGVTGDGGLDQAAFDRVQAIIERYPESAGPTDE